MMDKSETFKIDLKGLDDGISIKEYHLEDSYFAALQEENGATEISRGCVDAHLSINKIGNAFEVMLHTEGTIVIPCDICLDDMQQPISADYTLLVKLGAENSDEGDTIIVDQDDGILDISWLLYEYIDLAVPVRHVHAPGKSNPAMMKMLSEHSATRSGKEEQQEENVDPRWSALNKLKFKN